MVFKKPYAFFVKYFRVINFILTVLLAILFYKLSSLHNILNSIYNGGISNYSSLNSTYLGFRIYFLIILITVFLLLIILVLKRKDKPIRDYLLAILYNIILIIFFVGISNLFFSLENTTIDISTLKLYSDISLILMLPSLYFIFMFLLISIGFNLKKFNFTKDIIELKKEESDDEEVELIFNKNSYKYKRGIRKYIRELKYYFLENKFLITIIFGIVIIVLAGSYLSFNIFNSNKVSLNENFNAGNFSYVVNNVYETKYDLNNEIVKKGYKFIIASVTVKNNYYESSEVDFNRIRLLFGNEYVYSNNYYNKSFQDIGVPYNRQILKTNESSEFLFIFRVPDDYKKNKYLLKFYDHNEFVEEELQAKYKTLNIKPIKLDDDSKNKNIKLNEKVYFNKKIYGDSNFMIKSFEMSSSYIYNYNSVNNIIIPKTSNDCLFVLEYAMFLDWNKNFGSAKDEKTFFENFLKIKYKINEDSYYIRHIDIVKVGIDNKLFISVPNNVLNATEINVILTFRNFNYIFELK